MSDVFQYAENDVLATWDFSFWVTSHFDEIVAYTNLPVLSCSFMGQRQNWSTTTEANTTRGVALHRNIFMQSDGLSSAETNNLLSCLMPVTTRFYYSKKLILNLARIRLFIRVM